MSSSRALWVPDESVDPALSLNQRWVWPESVHKPTPVQIILCSFGYKAETKNRCCTKHMTLQEKITKEALEACTRKMEADRFGWGQRENRGRSVWQRMFAFIFLALRWLKCPFNPSRSWSKWNCQTFRVISILRECYQQFAIKSSSDKRNPLNIFVFFVFFKGR